MIININKLKKNIETVLYSYGVAKIVCDRKKFKNYNPTHKLELN